jgi:predicted amidophosphoribosyltransferase
MSRKKYRICPFCQTPYRSDCCPLCREERQHRQSTSQPDWAELELMALEEEIMRENGEILHYAYDYGIED